MRKIGFFIVVALLFGALTAHAQEATPEPEESTPEPVTMRDSPPSADSYQLTQVIGGLNHPLYLTGAGDGTGRLFVLEQTGRVMIVENDVLRPTAFINLSDVVSQDVLSGYSERGLLGIAFHPDFAINGYFYVNYTNRSGNTEIVRFQVSADDPNVTDRSTATEIMTFAQPYSNHNGGHMAFGPDGYLYISVGDGGSADDPLNTGQDPSDWLGSILRIDVDPETETRLYDVPEDNPFFQNSQFAPEVWHYGLRNVWRFSFDRVTGDMYLGDVGQNQWEEVNFVPADSPGGLNFGWRSYEGEVRYMSPEPTSEVTFPFAVYSHSGGSCSVTGGYVYRGDAIPDLQGVYLFSDYCSGRLWASYRTPDGAWQTVDLPGTSRRISSFGEDDSGELYLVDYNGAVLRFSAPGQ